MIGYLAVAGAAFFQATSLVLSRHAFLAAMEMSLQVDKFSAAFIRLSGGLLVAGMLLAAFKLRPAKKDSSPVITVNRLFLKGRPVSGQPGFWILLNALFGPVLGVTCWLWAVSLLNPGLVQSIAATAPLISIPIARLLERHSLGTRFYLGAPVAILGITSLMLW
nr:EamA family transporter [Oceanipulchritudo coccoides]